MSKLLILTFIVFGLQTDWLSDTQKLVAEIDNNSVLINTKEEKDKNGNTRITFLKSNDNQKINAEFEYEELINVSANYYEMNGFVFSEIMSGQDVLIYKRKRLSNEPYGTLFESQTYFKNENEGIKLLRKINIYETDEIDDIRKKMSELEFKKKELGSEDYKKIKEKYEQIKKGSE